MTNPVTEPRSLSTGEEYELLVQSIYDLIQETGFSLREQFIRMKYEVGSLIANSPCYERHQWGAAKIVKQIAEDLNTNSRDIYDCMQFYFRCLDYDHAKKLEHTGPDNWLNQLPGMGKHVSWNWVRKQLPENPKAPKKISRSKGSYRNALSYAKAREDTLWTPENTAELSAKLGVTEDEEEVRVAVDADLEVVRGEQKEDDWT